MAASLACARPTIAHANLKASIALDIHHLLAIATRCLRHVSREICLRHALLPAPLRADLTPARATTRLSTSPIRCASFCSPSPRDGP